MVKKESIAILLRIFMGESDHFDGKPLYQYFVEYLRKNHYAGATVLRGTEGFGKASFIHTSDILDLSSDLPMVVEVVDTEEKITQLKAAIEKNDMLKNGLITEEKVTIVKYG